MRMGSAASRAKKVAPAQVTENSALERRNTEDSRVFIPPKTPDSGFQTHPHDCLRDGKGCEVVADDVNLEEDVERIQEDLETTDSGLNGLFHKVFFRSKTCGLCYGKHARNGSDTVSDSGNNRLIHNDVARSDHQVLESRNITCTNPVTAGRADAVCTKSSAVPGLSDHPSLVFYDASEEELMNMIVREFG